MKYILFALIFCLFFPFYSFGKSNTDSSENCSYATQGVHTVSEAPYRKLLARLSGDKSKNKKRRNNKESTGQR